MKIALVFPDDFTAWHFYKSLLMALKEKGLDVYVISDIGGDYTGDYRRLIEGIGVNTKHVKINRYISPIKDLRLLSQLYKIFRQEQFDIVHCFYIKLMILGSIAAKASKTKLIFGTNEGMGVVGSKESGIVVQLLEPFLMWLVRISWKLSDRLWFTNKNDVDKYVSQGFLLSQKVIVTKNAINIEHFSPFAVSKDKLNELRRSLGIRSNDKVVVMIARMIWTKGIREFVDASQLIRHKYPHVKFLLVAPLDMRHPQAVSEKYIKHEEKSGSFLWIKFSNDVREIYALSDIVALPTYYNEGGYPRTLLEPMGMGKPVITTNSPDSRSVVEDSRNGYIIPQKDSTALSNAIEKLIQDERKCNEYGRYSRLIIERDFNEQVVIDVILHKLYNL